MTSTFKYLAYHISGENFFRGQILLSPDQIKIVIADLMKRPTRQDIYTSVQWYDKDSNIISCPIYADFDGENAVQDSREFITKFEKLVGVYPTIFFSGKKGVHLVVPVQIKHARCHHVVQHIVRSIHDCPSLDNKVYTSRRLWRVPHTFHTTGECYKTYLTPEELFLYDLHDLKEICKKKPEFPCTGKIEKPPQIIDLIIKEATEKVDKIEVSKKGKPLAEGDWSENMTPCIRHVLENCPEDGNMNASICLLAKFFKFYAVEREDAIQLVLEQEHYNNRQMKEQDVVKVIRSIYSSGIYTKVGCRFGSDGELLRTFCDNLCPHNKEEIWLS